MPGRISSLWLLALAHLIGCRSSPGHANTPAAAVSPALAGVGRVTDERKSASADAKVRAQAPSISALRKAIGLEVVGGRFAVWNGEFVAEGVVIGGAVEWRKTDLAQTGTVALHLAHDGTKVQWVRGEYADEQTFWGEDRLVLYGGVQAPPVAWAPGGTFSDVMFAGDGALVINKDKVFRVSASGEAMEVRTPLGKPRRLVRGGGESFVVCQPSKVRTPSFNGALDEGGVCACASSRGWKLELDWNEFPPVTCGGRLITFVKGKGGSRQHWTLMRSHGLDDGAVVNERAGRGAEVVCVGGALVEASGPGAWDAVSLQSVPRPLCNGEEALLWSSPDQKWCLTESGKLWPASGAGLVPETARPAEDKDGDGHKLGEERQ